MADGFEGTRLDPVRFPTAHELNTGEGRLMTEREARYASKLAHTDAFMSELQTQFANRYAHRFLHAPDVSEAKFVKHCGQSVPDDYLARFEHALYLIHCVCALAFTPTSAKKTPCAEDWGLSRYTDVLYFDVEAQAQPKRLVLQYVYTRPCAESFGFLRLALHDMARNCLYYGASLCVSAPVIATHDVLRKAWPVGTYDDLVFSVTPARLQNPERALGVEGLLLPTPCAYETVPPPHTAGLVDEFVAAQRRGTVFGSGPLLVDAFWKHAQGLGTAEASAVLRMRPDILLCFFQRLGSESARYMPGTGQWVLRPILKRERAALLDLDELVEQYLTSLTERFMDVTETELVARFRQYLEREHQVIEPEAYFTGKQILAAFNYIDAHPLSMHPFSELLKRYGKLYALGREGARIINPIWHAQAGHFATLFFRARGTGPAKRATLPELLADMRAYMDELDAPRAFFTDRQLRQGIDFVQSAPRERGYAKVRVGRTDYYEYGHL